MPSSDEDSISEKRSPFPRSVFFIIGNEFCERFSFYGMRAILVLYFLSEHQYQEEHALLVYHAFCGIAFFSPLFGSILSDNFFGRFRVILWVSVLYVFGHVLLTLGAVPDMGHGLRSFLDYGGLGIIALATGGIKPCVSAFGADQFPEGAKKQRERFFFFFYFSINAGSLLAIIVTPLLRGRISCLGSQYCFPLAFGVPGVLMLVALGLFMMGTPFYRQIPAESNIIWHVVQCFIYAVKRRFKGRLPGKESWMDYARPEFDRRTVEGVKSISNVCIVLAPVVVFWALFDQQGSTWVLQARRMNGRIGNFNVLPDQMNAMNPICVMFFIPFVESGLLPLCRRFGIKTTSLRRMGVGGFIAALSFLAAALVQIRVNPTLVALPPPDTVSLLVFSPHSPNCTFSATHISFREAPSNPETISKDLTKIPAAPAGSWTFQSSSCQLNLTLNLPEVRTAHGKMAYIVGIFRNETSENHEFYVRTLAYKMEKSEKGMGKLYVLTDSLLGERVTVSAEQEGKSRVSLDPREGDHLYFQPDIIGSDQYQFRIISESGNFTYPESPVEKFQSVSGGAWVLFLWTGSTAPHRAQARLEEVIAGNTVSMLYQIPQFALMTFGEVLFSVGGLEFTYSQAAPSMRSVMQALWLLTVFFGNLIAMVISGSHVIPGPEWEFFTYAIFMGVVMVVFVFLAWRYKYVEPDDFIVEEDEIALKELGSPD